MIWANKQKMSLPEWQEYIAERAVAENWGGATANPKHDAGMILHIMSKAEELWEAWARNIHQDKHVPSYHGIWVEMADMMMLMMHMAHEHKIDLAAVMADKADYNSARAWDKERKDNAKISH